MRLTVRLLAMACAVGLAGSAFAVDLSLPGPYGAGRQTVTIVRPDQSTFTAQLHYPAASTGVGTPYNGSGAPYPAITFGHGFLQTVDRYRSTLEHLATHGYFVIASDSGGSLFPSHAAFAADMSLCLTWLVQQNQNSGSFLFNQVITTSFGASGHSMGGGCSILAASADPRICAVAPLAPADTNPSAIAAIASVQAPVNLICGSADSIVPTHSNGQRMYDACPAPRRLPLIVGGWHCGFEDVSTFGCDSGPLDRATQLSITRRLLTEFFSLHLKGDQSLWRAVWGTDVPGSPAIPQVTLQRDARAALSPASQQIRAAAGQSASASIVITNNRNQASSFEVLIEDEPWAAAASPSATPMLLPGGASIVQVSVAVGSEGPSSGTMIVSARSNLDQATRAWAAVSVLRICLGDITPVGGNNTVDIDDLVMVITSWGATGANPADITGNGVVDIDDLVSVITHWGACP